MNTLPPCRSASQHRSRKLRANGIVLVFLCFVFWFFGLPAETATLDSVNRAYRDQEIVYKLSPFDLVKVSIYGQDDLAIEQRISDKGMLALPLLGGISVGGKSVSEAASAIERAFVSNQYLRNPVVSISIKQFAPKVVTVLGEVERPGTVEIPPGRNGIPILVAVAGAGGFSGTAKLTEVQVTRASSHGSVRKKEIVNMGKVLDSIKSGEARQVMAHPDDIIFVPRRVF